MRIYFYLIALTTILYINPCSAQCTGTTPSVYDITTDSVTISWSAPGAVAGYEYAVLPASQPQPSTGIATTNLMLRIGGLNAGNAYKAWHRTNCGGGQFSGWISISFSTPCGTPSSISIANVKGDSADISWTQVNPGANYQYHVDTLTTAPSTGLAVTSNTTRVKGLLSGKTYNVFVRTDCGSGVYSPWASSSFFTQWRTTVENIKQSNNIKLYPNPASNSFYIHSSTSSGILLNIYNTTGTLVKRSYAKSGEAIDISELSNGLYIIRLQIGEHTETLKLLKH